MLITDGYSSYNKVQGAARAGCWAHMRRKWLEATSKGADAKTCHAAKGYAFCNRLFELEHHFAGTSETVMPRGATILALGDYKALHKCFHI